MFSSGKFHRVPGKVHSKGKYLQYGQLIKSKNEETMLLNTANKPAVKLIINRHNNKYSYTSTSDENLLKNLDLFDKLSLKFSNRVLFMKDIVCSNEICCWSFYGESMTRSLSLEHKPNLLNTSSEHDSYFPFRQRQKGCRNLLYIDCVRNR